MSGGRTGNGAGKKAISSHQPNQNAGRDKEIYRTYRDVMGEQFENGTTNMTKSSIMRYHVILDVTIITYTVCVSGAYSER